MISQIKMYALIGAVGIFFILSITLAIVWTKWEHTKESRDFFKSLHDSNISYANKNDFKAAVDTLGLPVSTKSIQEVNYVTTRTKTTILTTIQDTIKNGQHLQCVDWSNGYSSLKGCFQTGVQMQHADTMDIVLHSKVVKRFAWIPTKRKDTLEIFNKDPDSKYNIRSFRRLNK